MPILAALPFIVVILWNLYFDSAGLGSWERRRAALVKKLRADGLALTRMDLVKGAPVALTLRYGVTRLNALYRFEARAANGETRAGYYRFGHPLFAAARKPACILTPRPKRALMSAPNTGACLTNKCAWRVLTVLSYEYVWAPTFGMSRNYGAII